ncbi:MAG TPA: hypothetical protein VNP98_00165 [Chthoniobacterales bacterium]|nr:hypothetical protein [Chthoniobacterales bacterium]
METHTCRLMPRSALLFAALLTLPFVAISTARGDAAAELASFSAFPKVDLAQLRGDAKPVRGGSGGSQRYLSVQTVYVAPFPPAELLAKMRSWNPARHSELKVYLHIDSGTNFSALQNAPDNSAVRYLTNATAQRSSDLQLSAAEMKLLPGENFASVWTKILSGRAQSGISSQPPYDNATPPVRPGEELNGLLGSQEKIRKQFSGLLSGGKSGMYWELLSVDEQGVLTLGTFSSRSGGGGTVQTANTRYYASGGYYAGVTLHQLWPVQVEGRASTLVWRGDMISSGSIASLRGIERIAAESTMIKDISRVVSLFRRDIGGVR